MNKSDIDKVGKNRINWLDYLKAFACFLVLFCHLLQSLDKIGINKYTNISVGINTIVYLFHMPLFMCISGYLYSLKSKEFTFKEYKKFEIKKIINLAIPYFTFQLLSILLSIIFSNNVNYKRSYRDLLNMFNSPIPPYWFLYALLAIFIIVPLIEKIFKNDKYKVITFFIILKIISIFVTTRIYFIDSIMNYAIYFYLGAFVNKIKKTYINEDILYSVIYILLGIFYYIYKSNLPKTFIEIIEIIFAITGIIICFNIFKKVKKSKIMDTYKKYTLQIFLLHTICAAGVRVVLLKLGIRDYWIHLTIGLLASIYFPVFISKFCERIKYLDFFFYPVKTIQKIRSNEDERKET